MSENEPNEFRLNEFREEQEAAERRNLRDRRPSARGESARAAVAEIVSKPWKEYFDDVDSVSTPKKLVEGDPRDIQGLNPSPLPPSSSPLPVATLTTQSILEGIRPESRASYITPASKSFGTYLQTTLRHLVPESDADVDLYAKGAEKSYFNFANGKQRDTARVLFTFKARSPRELSVHKGDQVILIKTINDKWVECESKGRTGMLPTSYLELTAEGFRVIEYGSAVGKYDFKKKSPKQLSFRKEDELILIRRIDQNWYEARLTNKDKGYVPLNHIEVSKEPVTNQDDRIGRDLISPALSANSRPTSAHHQSQSSNVTVIQAADGPQAAQQSDDVFTDKGLRSSVVDELNMAVDELSTLSVRMSEELEGETVNSATATTRDLIARGARPAWVPSDAEQYQAIYNFAPQHEDELALSEGDLVYVFEKCADGWFIGAHGSSGSIGTFPGNYTTKA